MSNNQNATKIMNSFEFNSRNNACTASLFRSLMIFITDAEFHMHYLMNTLYDCYTNHDRLLKSLNKLNDELVQKRAMLGILNVNKDSALPRYDDLLEFIAVIVEECTEKAAERDRELAMKRQDEKSVERRMKLELMKQIREADEIEAERLMELLSINE